MVSALWRVDRQPVHPQNPTRLSRALQRFKSDSSRGLLAQLACTRVVCRTSRLAQSMETARVKMLATCPNVSEVDVFPMQTRLPRARVLEASNASALPVIACQTRIGSQRAGGTGGAAP